MNKKELAVLTGLIFTILFSLCSESIAAAESVKANTLRLHIIANSDTSADQNIKLAVRDSILQSENLIISQEKDFNTAVENLNGNLQLVEDNINRYLAQAGADYKAKCSIEQFYFDTTAYSGFVLPQGEYTALTVRLGNAQGKNWWCVIYPALCSQSCGETALQESDGFIKTDSITPRFKVVELYENVKEHFTQRTQKYENLP